MCDQDMAIEVDDVRAALGGMTKGEVPDATVQQKIKDAELIAEKVGLSTAPGIPLRLTEKFIRDYAAWRSFLFSRTYERIDIGDVGLQQKEMIKLRAAELKKDAEQSFDEAYGGVGFVVATNMWDDRLDDPYYEGEEEDTTIIVHG